MTEQAGRPPGRAPDREGVAKVWEVELGDTPERFPGQHDLHVGTALIHAPGSHPLWAWHVIFGVSLAVTADAPTPRLHFPEATHEIICFALDPRVPLPDPDNWEDRSDGMLLQPPDFVVQFMVDTDEQAAGVWGSILSAVEHGAQVDSDAASWWETSIRATAAHYREGRHQ